MCVYIQGCVLALSVLTFRKPEVTRGNKSNKYCQDLAEKLQDVRAHLYISILAIILVVGMLAQMTCFITCFTFHLLNEYHIMLWKILN